MYDRQLLEYREYHGSERAEVLAHHSIGLAQIPPSTVDNKTLDQISGGNKIRIPEKEDRIATLVDKARAISVIDNIGVKAIRYDDVFEIIFYPGKTAIFREVRYMIEHMDEGFIQICPDTGRLEIHCILNLFRYEDEIHNMLMEDAQNDILLHADMDFLNKDVQDMIRAEKIKYERKFYARRR